MGCIHQCKMNQTGCENFEHEVTKAELKEINYEITRQNVNLHKFAKQHGLKYSYVIRMLHGKMKMNYKTLKLLNERLNEKDWVIEYIERQKSEEMINIV